MPQRWVGRFVAVFAATVVAVATVQPAAAAPSNNQPVAVRFAAANGWEIGTLAYPGDEPTVVLYLARRTADGVTLATEGTAEFGVLAVEAGFAFAGTRAGDLLATTDSLGAGASASASLGLPWTDGHAWRLTGGPHNNYGKSKHPWSSLDFNGPVGGGSYKVRSARGGIVTRPCANLVQIRHGDGWTTSYYHLANIQVSAGQSIGRGALLGYTSTRAGCGGYASGPHVHFSVLKNGSHVNLDGLAIGGWTVKEGQGQYYGCLVRNGSKKCAPGGSVYNSGAIGSG